MPYLAGYRAGLKPLVNLAPSKWADTYGRLIREGVDMGPWRTRPVQKAILDAFGESRIEWIICKKSARIGWTKILGHIKGYYIHQDACSILMVQPTKDDAMDYSKEDIQPMIDNTPALEPLVSKGKTKNTLTEKHYPGGILHVCGANSPGGFRRITVRIVLFDEVDGYPSTAGKEGDQIKLGAMRGSTESNRIVAMGSTPTTETLSRISHHFNRSSRGYCFLTCPHCGGEHIRLFRKPKKQIEIRGKSVPVSHVVWDDDKPETAHWVCPDNGCVIQHLDSADMLDNCKWIGDHWGWTKDNGFEYIDGFKGRIGFSIWSGYGDSPQSTPEKMVEEFIDAKDRPDTLKTFVNTILGEEWVEPGESVDDTGLLARCEEYAAQVPLGVSEIDVGVDVQPGRIEAEAVGYGANEENWSIDYQVFWGNTSQPEVWEDLRDFLKGTYQHESGATIGISSVCIDSGYLSDVVYKFVRSCNNVNYYSVKGVPGSKPIVEAPAARLERLRRRRKKGPAPELVGNDAACTLLYRCLNSIPVPGPGYCHFPIGRDAEYFKQLTAMELRTSYYKGVPRTESVQKYTRAEAHDCRKYAMAAHILFDGNHEAQLAAILRRAEQKKNITSSKIKIHESNEFGSDEWSDEF